MGGTLKELIVDILSDSSRVTRDGLQRIPLREWSHTLPWLDASGLALYLLSKLQTLDLASAVPFQVTSRLKQNLEQNRARVADAADQLRNIQEVLTSRNVEFILLKGLSLSPEACDDPSLRLQIDTDLLIDAHCVQAAQHALATLDYALTACGGSTWEFKTRTDSVPSLHDLYKPKPQRSVELHLAPTAEFCSLCQQAVWREQCGVRFPCLSSSERFLSQAKHLFKHMQSEWIRLSWLLEFQHSAIYWSGNEEFWSAIETRGRHTPDIAIALGAAVALTQTVFPTRRLPQTLLRNVTAIDGGMRLWIERFGRRAAMARFPGTKLYLLQPTDHSATAKMRRRRLLPLRTPPTLITSQEGATPWMRLRALRAQLSFFAFRMAFHLRENSRYLIEAPRWRRCLAQLKS